MVAACPHTQLPVRATPCLGCACSEFFMRHQSWFRPDLCACIDHICRACGVCSRWHSGSRRLTATHSWQRPLMSTCSSRCARDGLHAWQQVAGRSGTFLSVPAALRLLHSMVLGCGGVLHHLAHLPAPPGSPALPNAWSYPPAAVILPNVSMRAYVPGLYTACCCNDSSPVLSLSICLPCCASVTL